MKKPLIAVTMGDPGGVGPEIVLKAVQSLGRKARFLLVGKKQVFDKANRLLKRPLHFQVIETFTPKVVRNFARPLLLDLPREPVHFYPRKINKTNGMLAYLSLKTAVEIAKKGYVSALVTAPLSKTAVRLYKRSFRDQTEFLSEATRTRKYAMTFVKDRFCVTLTTTHVPIRRVAFVLRKRQIVDKTILTAQFLKKAQRVKEPKIAILGLNPHAGESGFLGKEELKIIIPAVSEIRRRGIDASGPYPADSAFYLWRNGKFDAIVAMYHDQGLAPFKMLYFHDGVHITLGLPFVRTSPDHGTAFDMAYLGKASFTAMREAILVAIRFSKK